MRQLAWVLAICAGAAHAALQTLPQVTFSVMLDVPHRDPTKPGIKQAITSIASEGMTGLEASNQFCEQLKQQPIVREYQVDEFFDTCEQTFRRAIAAERAVALGTDPAYYEAVSSLNIHLSNQKVALDRLERSIIKQPTKTSILRRMMEAQTGNFCEVGFGEGGTALLALQSMRDSKVFSFEGDEQDVTIAAHDFIDPKYPDRLTLYLGDPSVLIPRLITLNPGLRCSGFYIDGSVDDFTLRDALVDFRELADYGQGGHFLAINVPADEGYASSVATTLLAAEGRGELSIHTVVRGGMVGSLKELRGMSTSQYYANSLVIASFPAPVTSADVPAQP